MDVHANHTDVRFDYAGALALARDLWQLAGRVDSQQVARGQAYNTAKCEWRGRYADESVTRMAHSDTAAGVVASQLRSAANRFAQAWADAHAEQTRRLHAREVERQQNDRGVLESAGDWLFGDDTDYGAAPTPPAVPTGPDFTVASVNPVL